MQIKTQQAVCHTLALPFTLKKYLKAKNNNNNYESSNISPCKNYNLQKKIPLKETQNPLRYYNSVTNLKFQHELAQILSFKNPHIKNRPIIIT
jgi:hypothetical protein